MNGKRMRALSAVLSAVSLTAILLATIPTASAQTRRTGGLGDILGGGLGSRLINIRVGDITLESVNFRDQTARLNVGLNVSNPFIPVALRDFDYSLSLYGQPAFTGRYDGEMRLGGRGGSRVNLPIDVHLRSIPDILWQAFSNRGNVRYELGTGFTLPLFITERRFEQNFSGEVPLRTVVDAATIMRARTGTGGGNGRGALGRIGDILGGW